MGATRIADILPQKIPVPSLKGMEVRGITLEETAKLIDKYKEPLYAFFAAPAMDFGLLAMQSPTMVADIIALGADAVGQEEDIKKLPLQAQVDTLSAIWQQTVPNVEGLLASLARASESLRVAREKAVTPQPSIGSSPTSSTPSLVPVTRSA